MRINTLIVGDDGINTLGLVRSLGEAGYKPDVIVTSDNLKKVFVKHSKYINNCIIVEKESQAVFDVLINFNCGEGGCYLFPTSDFVLKVIGDNYSELSKRFILPSVSEKIGNLTDALSKNNTFVFAEKAGFSVPAMRKITIDRQALNDSDIKNTFTDLYPLIIKADCFYENSTDFVIVENEKVFYDFLENNIGKTVIVQQFIENAEELAVQCVGFGNEKKPEAYGVIHKIRTSVFALGTTTYAVLKDFDDKDLYNKCVKFAELLDYSGIYDLDILSKNGKYYFIECNFRNGSNGYAYTKFGANLPKIWIDRQSVTNKKNNLLFVNDFGDFAHVLRKNIGFFKWLSQYFKSDCRLSFNIKDPKPFFAESVSLLFKNIK